MKARVYCFGHGWALEMGAYTRYVGSFAEIWPMFDEWCAQVQIAAWLDIYKERMGTEAHTRGTA